MTAMLLNGKELAKKRRSEIKTQVGRLKEMGITPGLAVVLVGENPASVTYVRSKEKACHEVGIYSEVIRLPETITEEELLQVIEELNRREEIDGILVQLPLPSHIREQVVINRIAVEKDVDGFTPVNQGKLLLNEKGLFPCTPLGIIDLLKETGQSIAGKHAVVIGRSNIVGKPVSLLLLHQHATVTMAHSRTVGLKQIAREADILVAAMGQAKKITSDYIKPGAIVIDVGINRDENGKLVGDVDFEAVCEVAGCITPVPGGVGPMTITMLLQNTLQASLWNHHVELAGRIDG
ncbi:methylenetetrahydrofolate dehydrogenase; methenyltetrahydrofolate cyclohydrolase [[Clostridium] ultunense Esp]|nr:methylenetetrahydrofolate dehydrogenase; methenyltetrahydrofolate cyclohydrolase [[Clostridium] ultunense Esp]